MSPTRRAGPIGGADLRVASSAGGTHDLDERSKLVEGLLKLAADAETNPWSGRLYMAAALWLETEIGRDGGASHDPATSIAAETVHHREFGPEPELFRGCVNAWLNPAK